MAGSQQQRPAVAIWNASEGRSENISTGLMRPLYTSCREHFHAQEKNRQTCTHPSNNGGIVKSTSARSNTDPTPRQLRPRFLTLNSLPRMPSSSPEKKTCSGFLRLPTEIRLQIYSLLVLPQRVEDLLASFEKVHASTSDYFDYENEQFSTDRKKNLRCPTLHFRTVDPLRYSQRYGASCNNRHSRTGYSVQADRFRARCMETTYQCVNNPRIEDNLAIMRTSKQIHAEAAELLYSSYTFDFDTHVEAVTPFLSDLTPLARSCIKNIRIVKRALPYLKEFDRCEWHNAMRYITNPHNDVSLRRFELGIVAGRPGPQGWDRVPTYTASDFEIVSTLEGMEWMQYILDVQGLQELEVQAVIEHCPPITSSTRMANYVRFSASVEGGFRDFLTGRMISQAVRA